MTWRDQLHLDADWFTHLLIYLGGFSVGWWIRGRRLLRGKKR